MWWRDCAGDRCPRASLCRPKRGGGKNRIAASATPPRNDDSGGGLPHRRRLPAMTSDGVIARPHLIPVIASPKGVAILSRWAAWQGGTARTRIATAAALLAMTMRRWVAASAAPPRNDKRRRHRAPSSHPCHREPEGRGDLKQVGGVAGRDGKNQDCHVAALLAMTMWGDCHGGCSPRDDNAGVDCRVGGTSSQSQARASSRALTSSLSSRARGAWRSCSGPLPPRGKQCPSQCLIIGGQWQALAQGQLKVGSIIGRKAMAARKLQRITQSMRI